jgi:hypothetical protein
MIAAIAGSSASSLIELDNTFATERFGFSAASTDGPDTCASDTNVSST